MQGIKKPLVAFKKLNATKKLRFLSGQGFCPPPPPLMKVFFYYFEVTFYILCKDFSFCSIKGDYAYKLCKLRN